MDIEQWSVIWLSLKEVLLLIEFFHESLIEKRHSAQRRASVAGPLRHVLPPHVLSLYGSSNKRWPLVTSAAALLCSASSCAIKPWRTRKKHFVSQWEREQRYTVTTEENILFNLWTKDFNLWEGVDINTVQDTGRWFGSAVLTFVRNCAFLCLTKSVRISLLKKKIHITIYEDVVILIFSVRVSENLVFFFDENLYCLIIG